MITTLLTLIPIFGIIFLGVVVERVRLMPPTTPLCLNQFVYWIGLPAFLFNQLARLKAGEASSGLIFGLLVGIFLSYLVAHLFGALILRRTKDETTLFALLGNFPNGSFMGISTIALLMPDNQTALVVASISAVVYNIVFIFADTRLELGRHQGERWPRAMLSLVRSSCQNPVLIASALGGAVSFLEIPMPKSLLAMSSMLGATAAPCALFCMGMILSIQMTSSVGFPKHWFWSQLPVHFIKIILLPCLTYIGLIFFGIEGLELAVAVLIAGMPTGITCYVLAEKFNVSIVDSSLIIFVNTALSILSIPLSIIILHWANLL